MFTDVVLEVLATVPAITKDFAVAVKTSVNELLVIADEVSEKLLAIYYSPPKAIANANPAAFN
jgi:TusA-related sulfurtransferase